MISFMSFALERQVRFLTEKRSKPSKLYGARASQAKIVPGGKSALQVWALPELEGHGT